MGATWTTVCQTVWALRVVQRNGARKSRWTSLDDAYHVTAWAVVRFAQEEEGVPASAFVIVRCRFIPLPELFDAQMWSDS